MAYFRDLTPYTYFPLNTAELPDDAKALNVGWLEEGQPLPQGEVPTEFIRALAVLDLVPVMPTRGWHRCPFCAKGSSSAEVRAQGQDGTFYCAPQMILHYVLVHWYQPPQEFIDAVLYTMRNATIRLPREGPTTENLLREANELLDAYERELDRHAGQAPERARSFHLEKWWSENQHKARGK